MTRKRSDISKSRLNRPAGTDRSEKGTCATKKKNTQGAQGGGASITRPWRSPGRGEKKSWTTKTHLVAGCKKLARKGSISQTRRETEVPGRGAI